MPPMILVADGGGSKVLAVIRTADGVEVRGQAGPCNVSSIGTALAIQRLLLATYRALLKLPPSYLPSNFTFPPLPTEHLNGHINHHHHQQQTTSTSKLLNLNPSPHLHLGNPTPINITPFPSRPPTPPSTGNTSQLPDLPLGLFQYVWFGLAGIQGDGGERAFEPLVREAFGFAGSVGSGGVRITNDVNLLAAPALEIPGINHVLALVCGTGTVGRTIRINRNLGLSADQGKRRELPLEDLGISRGWGYMLCDEGSAYHLGRASLRSILSFTDRQSRQAIYTSPPPQLLPFHQDLLKYFDTPDPGDLIGLVSLSGSSVEALGVGEAIARRNALVAGAARTVLGWAFPAEGQPPSPALSTTSSSTGGKPNGAEIDPVAESQKEALKLAKATIIPLIELALSLLGDGTVVKPDTTALALGGGLMSSPGYRGLLLYGLKEYGVVLKEVVLVGDAAGVGARGLAGVEFD